MRRRFAARRAVRPYHLPRPPLLVLPSSSSLLPVPGRTTLLHSTPCRASLVPASRGRQASPPAPDTSIRMPSREGVYRRRQSRICHKAWSLAHAPSIPCPVQAPAVPPPGNARAIAHAATPDCVSLVVSAAIRSAVSHPALSVPARSGTTSRPGPFRWRYDPLSPAGSGTIPSALPILLPCAA